MKSFFSGVAQALHTAILAASDPVCAPARQPPAASGSAPATPSGAARQGTGQPGPLAPDPNANGMVNLHSVWVPATREHSAAGRKFRQSLVSSYLVLANDAGSRPCNVEPNLWTTRPIDLFKPVFLGDRGNRVELEVPHSILANGPVTVRDEATLPAQIEALTDPQARHTLQAFYHHPANDNIGFRSDVLRLAIGLLHVRHGASGQAGAPPEINLYADVDQVASTQLSKSGSTHAQLTERESRTQTLADSVQGLALPPAPRNPLSQAELRRLASAPQRSWSSRRNPVPGRGPAVPLPADAAEFGYLSRNDEIDVVAMIPGHPALVELANNILQVLDTHTHVANYPPTQELFDAYQWHGLKSATMVRALRTGRQPPTELVHGEKEIVVRDIGQDDLLDMFRFAEKLRQLRPALLEKMAHLQAAGQRGDAAAHAKMLAIEDVHRWHVYLIDAFVNMSTYLPQMEHSVVTGGEPLDALAEAVLGAPLVEERPSGDSWKGGLLPALDERLPTTEIAVMKLVYEELRAMMKSEQVA